MGVSRLSKSSGPQGVVGGKKVKKKSRRKTWTKFKILPKFCT